MWVYFFEEKIYMKDNIYIIEDGKMLDIDEPQIWNYIHYYNGNQNNSA
jgi:hypothetical protein